LAGGDLMQPNQLKRRELAFPCFAIASRPIPWVTANSIVVPMAYSNIVPFGTVRSKILHGT
jgi:hypothetical protein